MSAKILIVLILLLGATSFLGAQTVAEDVLRAKEFQGIEFKSYVGPHKVIESRSAIQGIGADLGRQMKGVGVSEADYAGKYHLLRLHDPAADKLSADMLILGPGAGVDHIRNLNWIVSAYLQQAFGYSVVDADLLADFVTRYNAYYRGNLDYVKSAYIPVVLTNVTAENLGLSTNWAEWAGKSRILIPLRDSLSKGLAGSLNTEEVSNKDIVTQMAQEPGQGLEDRKKLADLKEGEIVQEQKAIAQAEAKVPAVPSATGTTAAGPTTTPAATNATPPGSTTAPATNPTTAAAGTTPAAPATLPLDQAKQQLAARDQALQSERQDIVKQENKTPATVPVPPTAAVKPATLVAFVRMNGSSKTGQLWLIDPVANAVWKKSDLNAIRQPLAPAFGAGYLVIAGDTKGANGAVRLVLMSKDDASVLVTGIDDMAPDASFGVSGNQVLALTKGTQGNWVLGAFDPTLKAVVKGTDALDPLTAVVPTANGILVQGASGQVLLLDIATLKKKSATGG